MKADKHHIFRSFGYAWKGIRSALRSERNFQFHLFTTLFVCLLGFILQLSTAEWVAIVLCIGLVLTAELLNTAIEKVVDLISPEWNEKAGCIKDIAAGAVLIASATALITGLIIFIPKFLAFISPGF